MPYKSKSNNNRTAKRQPSSLAQIRKFFELHWPAILAFVILFGFAGSYFVFKGHAYTNFSSTTGSIVGIDNKCITNSNGTTADHNPVVLYGCNSTPSQRWSINLSGQGTMVNVNGYCMSVLHGSTSPGSTVDIYKCDGSAAQNWTVNFTTHSIVNDNSGLCLTDLSSVISNGNPIVIDPCAGIGAQMWRTPKIDWIVGQGAISQMEQAGASSQLITQAFSNNNSYVYGDNSSNHDTASTIGVPTFASASYAQIQAAFASGLLPGAFKAVIYDNERWAATPLNEQQNPAYYEKLTGELLHQHDLLYIATPAPDLMWSVGQPADSYQAFLQADYPGDAARYADVYDIQGQQREDNLPYFTNFVTVAAKEARQANPRVKVLIGLRTNPGTAVLESAYSAVETVGDGYWLNVNGIPIPAVSLLQAIYNY
jgi:Ricin-type beta-trefoil lectin domain